METMTLSREELEQDRFTEANLGVALRTLREVGFVAIENALPIDWVEEFRVDYETVLKRDDEASNEQGNTSPFLNARFLDARIIDNPFAMQIIEGAMGNRVFSYLPYGCNTAEPDCDIQWIHRDSGQLFPEVPVVLPVCSIVINIPLIDFTIENGATEIWPGSHLIFDDSEVLNKPYNVCNDERAAQLPSFQMVMPAGSVVVRDMRCWHRRMPNRTQTLRSMLALVYFRRLHHVPDDAGIFSATIPPEAWEHMSERCREVYRFYAR